MKSLNFQCRTTDKHLLSLQEILFSSFAWLTNTIARRRPGRFYKDISWWSKCVWAQPCIMHVQQSVQSSRNQGEMSANCAGRLTTVPFLLKPVTVSQRDVFFFPCLNYFRSVLFFRISILHNWLELHNDPSSSNILLSSGDVSIVLHLHAVSFLLHSGFDEVKWLKNSIWIG